MEIGTSASGETDECRKGDTIHPTISPPVRVVSIHPNSLFGSS
jgi:hypothetical protein